MLKVRAILSLCLVVLPASICHALEDVAPIEEIHIVGSRIERHQIDFPADRVILDRETIQLFPMVDILDLMRGLPGIDSFRQGGPGSKQFFSIRGGDPNFTVIMLDGTRLNDPTDSRGGGFDLALLAPGGIESIEIVKGALATAYGADALSGVINIITHRPQEKVQLSFFSEGDTNDAFQVGANLRGPLADGVTAALSAAYTDGGTALEGDRRKRLNLGGQIAVSLADFVDIRVTSFLADGSATAFPEDSGGARLAVLRQIEERDDRIGTIGAVFAFRAVGHWRPNLSVQWSKTSNRSDHPGIAAGTLQGIPASDTDTRFRQFELTASNRLSLAERLTVDLGATYRSENGQSKSVLDFGFPVAADFALERKTISAFGQGRLQFGGSFNFSFGTRLDHIEGNLNRVTNRLSASYVHVSSGTEAEISWGQGFKLPSFFALGHPIVGNSELDPEKAENFSITVKRASTNKRFEWVVSGFRNHFRNLIDFDPVLFQTVNRLRVRAEGIEIGIVARPSKTLELATNMTYQKIRIPGTATRLRFRPAWKGSFRGSWHLTTDLSVSISGFTNGRYFDSSIPTGPISRSGFSRFDAVAKWAINKSVKIDLAVFNLFDSRYEEAIGFPSLPRTARLKLTASL